MDKKVFFALVLAALISLGTAIAHGACIILGPSCFQAQMAPPEIVQSAIDGTLLAPVGTLIICSIFVICAVYALSAAGIFKQLPFLKFVLAIISFICIIRGLATLPLSLLYPDMVSTFSIFAGMVWAFTGVLFYFGFACLKQVKT